MSTTNECDNDPDGEDSGKSHNRFSLTNFLFGNVDKHGDLEEFGDDEEERVALNQLSRAHVSELDMAVEIVIADNEKAEQAIAEDKSLANMDTVAESKENCAEDFYDINEAIDEPKIDLSQIDLGPANADDEDYDADDDGPDVPAEKTEASSTSPILLMSETPETATTSVIDSTVGRQIEPSVDISEMKSSSESGATDEQPIIDDDYKSMPPPQIIPPISPALKSTSQTACESQEVKVDSTSSSTPITIDIDHHPESTPPPGDPAPPTELISTNSDPPSFSKLNTPLGNMMPEEYSNVDIRELFPEYDPDRTPRWSRLFKPVYPVCLYKDVCCTFFNNQLWTDDREHIFFQYLDLGRVAKLDEMMSDDADKLRAYKGSAAEAAVNAAQSRQKKEDEAKAANKAGMGLEHSREPTWRNGPAKLWYDMLGLPMNVDVSKMNFSSFARTEADKSSVIKEESKKEVVEQLGQEETQTVASDQSHDINDVQKEKEPEVYGRIPLNNLVPINQVNWEDDIIWDAQQSANKIISGHRANAAYAGWFPTNLYRTMAKFQDAYCTEYPGILPAKSTGTNTERADPATWRSIFPVENETLISGNWQKDIIWDINDMPPPSLLTLDPNDENLLPMDMPVEEGPSNLSALVAKMDNQAAAAIKRGAELTPNKMNKSKDKDTSKARLLLGRHGLLNEEDKPDDYEEVEEEAQISPKKKDPFNLSNDEYYYPRQLTSTRTAYVSGPNIGYTSGAIIQHSTPAMELRHPFFPLHLNVQRLRHFHRPMLKRYNRGVMSQYHIPHPVCNLAKHIRKKGKIREEERAACGGGEIFFMRTPTDLSGMDGELILAEYSEEFPPLMMQVGMNTRMLNYYKRPSSKEAGSEVAPPHLKYGELVYVHQSPFLGQLKPSQCVQTLENNMFRSPVYSHQMEPSDFLVVRNRNGFYIRKINDIFTVGQCYPLMEVPAPNSKKANNFIRDALQVYIYRLFRKSIDEPRKIKIEDVRKAFPNHSESSVRKRLKLCSDFKRTGVDASWWVLRQDFRLPTEEELRAMVSPEDYCAYYSMAAAEQRLKDAGYGEKYLFPPPGDEEDEEKESQVKMADEVRAAPWNTTHAYLSAMRGKCYLELHGAADPTGCGEAFSFAKVSSKPGAILKEGNDLVGTLTAAPAPTGEPAGTGVGLGRRMVTGTDADLRKLHLRDAKAMLKDLGFEDGDIKKLKRWDVIDVIRKISTLQAKKGKMEGMAKFARGSRLSTSEQLERYKEECQQIFDLQNRVMTSEEVLSTDDASSSDPDDAESDLEDARHFESMLANKITSNEFRQKREEQERRQLQRKIDSGEAIFDSKKQRRKPTKGDDPGTSLMTFDDSSRNNNDLTNHSASTHAGNRVLVIRRKFKTDEGKSYWRTETVPWGPVADIYHHIRNTRSHNFIKDYVGSDEHEKELIRREKRREQDKKRRQNKLKGQRSMSSFSRPHGYQGDDSNQGDSISGDYTRKKSKPMTAALSKMRCGACGATGHMRTNKECPKYNQPNARAERPAHAGKIVRKYRTKKRMAMIRDMAGGMTVEELLNKEKKEAQSDDMPFNDSELTKVEGTKLKMSGNVMRYFEKRYKSDLKITIPRKIYTEITEYQEYKEKQDKMAAKTKRSKGKMTPSTPASRAELQRGDYSTSAKNKGNRRRIDPKVALNHLLEQIYKGIQTTVSNYKTFLYPPKDREFPQYKHIVKDPMHLLTIRQKIQNNEYNTRQEFMWDINLIRENCVLFNGQFSEYTETATQICSYVLEEFASKERKFMRLERMVNPLLDEDDLVGFNYLLQNIVEMLFKVENSRPFHQPVDKKRYKDYYTRVQTPMDLKSIECKTKSSKYRSQEDFLNDVEQIVTNCVTYNGDNNPLTLIARNILTAAREKVKENEKTLDNLEAIIKKFGDELSVTGVDTDSVAEPSIHTDHQSQAGEASFEIPTTPLTLNQSSSFKRDFTDELGPSEEKVGDDLNTSMESNELGEESVFQSDAGMERLMNFSRNEEEEDEDADDEEEDGAPQRKRFKLSVEDEKKKLEGDLRLSSDSDEEMEDGNTSVVSSPQGMSQDNSKINSPTPDASQNLDSSLQDHLALSEDEEEDQSQYYSQNLSRDLTMSDDGDESANDDNSPVKFYIGEDTNDATQSQSNREDDNDLADHF